MARTEKELLIELGGMVRKIGEDAEGGRAEAKEDRERLRALELGAEKASGEREALAKSIADLDRRVGRSRPLRAVSSESQSKLIAIGAVVAAAVLAFGWALSSGVFAPEPEQTTQDETEDGGSDVAGDIQGGY